MEYILYLTFRLFVLLFRFVPFWFLYGFADIVFYIIYYLTGYRKKVVLQNLRNSLPERSSKEINRIARVFYHHLSDLLIESMKAFSMSEARITRRYRILNPEVMDQFYQQGRSVICVAGHYGNWEWAGSATGTQLKHLPIGFYKPLSNKYIDGYIQRSRIKGRCRLASITRTAETFQSPYPEPAVFFMIADQSPSSARLAYWVDFLNQETATLHGPEKYARIHNLPVIFAVPRKVRRGYYETTFDLLESNPATTKTGEITRKFMKKLEEVVVAEPEYYLWSHRRWKLKKPEK